MSSEFIPDGKTIDDMFKRRRLSLPSDGNDGNDNNHEEESLSLHEEVTLSSSSATYMIGPHSDDTEPLWKSSVYFNGCLYKSIYHAIYMEDNEKISAKRLIKRNFRPNPMRVCEVVATYCFQNHSSVKKFMETLYNEKHLLHPSGLRFNLEEVGEIRIYTNMYDFVMMECTPFDI